MARDKLHQEIGILGGTFDPVHNGHLAVAQSILEHCQLDQILFVPAYAPPHKEKVLTPFKHRVAMLELCLSGTDNMSVSMLEAERTSPSYTVETLHEFHRRMGQCRFYLIVGADMFVEIELWYRYRDIFDLASVIVAARPGVAHDRVAEQVRRLPGNFDYDPDRQQWLRDDGCRVLYLEDVEEPISSSKIRQALAQGSPVDELVPGPVIDYIRQHGLYMTPQKQSSKL